MAQAPYYNLDVITPHISSSPYLLYGSPHPALLGYAGGNAGGGGGGGLLPPIRGASPPSMLPFNVQPPQGQRSPTPSSGSNGVPFSGYGAELGAPNGAWVMPSQQTPQSNARGALNGGAGGAGGNNGWVRVGQYQNNWGNPRQVADRNPRPSLADMPAAGIRQGPGSPRQYDLISGGGPGHNGYGGRGHISPADLPAAGARKQQRDVYNIVTNQGGPAGGGARAAVGGGGDYGNAERGGGARPYQNAPAGGARAGAPRRYSNYLMNGYEEPVQGVRNIASSAVKYDIITGAPLS